MTAFEYHFRAAVFCPEVRTILMFLQGSAGNANQQASSSNGPAKADKQVAHQLKQLTEQNQSLKRKLDNAGSTNWAAPSKGDDKGKKGKHKGRRVPSTPAAWGPNVPGVLDNGDRICYAYNLKSGCVLAKAGKRCNNGYHVCPLCPDAEPAHSLMDCKKHRS